MLTSKFQGFLPLFDLPTFFFESIIPSVSSTSSSISITPTNRAMAANHSITCRVPKANVGTRVNKDMEFLLTNFTTFCRKDHVPQSKLIPPIITSTRKKRKRNDKLLSKNKNTCDGKTKKKKNRFPFKTITPTG